MPRYHGKIELSDEAAAERLELYQIQETLTQRYGEWTPES